MYEDLQIPISFALGNIPCNYNVDYDYGNNGAFDYDIPYLKQGFQYTQHKDDFDDCGIETASLFTPAFLRLLINEYYTICIDPTVTPFDTTRPPSGILSRAAKSATAIASAKGVPIYSNEFEQSTISPSLSLIRRTLLQEILKEN